MGKGLIYGGDVWKHNTRRVKKKLPSTITPEPALREQQFSLSLYLAVPPSSTTPSYVRMHTTVKQHVAGTVKCTCQNPRRKVHVFQFGSLPPRYIAYQIARQPDVIKLISVAAQRKNPVPHLELNFSYINTLERQRMPNKYVYYYRSPQHQNHYVLSFAFAFDREEDVYQFAFSYPYSYSKCQVHLDLLEKKQFPHFHRELLATTVQQRRLDLVTITHPNNMPLGSKKQHVVVILSRIHPGESPASYVCQGLIDFLVSSHPIAQVLRDHVVFKIIPMMNPDGVYLGNYR
uniref:Peptidase M14 domain-containing protein n=1 Tax=Timema douglasi TaxID=61478 RepID=A0A7R8VAV8_TIMDO|nr:unnamed protein product [Timema douglasi]